MRLVSFIAFCLLIAPAANAGQWVAGHMPVIVGQNKIDDSGIPLPVGPFADTSDVQTFLNKTIDGSRNNLSNIGNGSLVNPAITIGGQTTPLGGVTTNQGNGEKLQLSTGATTQDHVAVFDANGNTTDSGKVLGGAATLNVGTTTSTVAAGDDSRITGAAQKSTLRSNAKALGASGNGSTDDGTILNSIFSTDCPVSVPNGTYKSSIPLVLSSGCAVAGFGSSNTTFKRTSTGNLFNTLENADVSIHDFSGDNNYQNDPNTGHVIAFRDGDNLNAYNIHVFGYGGLTGSGLIDYPNDPVAGVVNNVVVHDFWATRNVADVLTGTGGNGVALVNCTHCREQGIYAENQSLNGAEYKNASSHDLLVDSITRYSEQCFGLGTDGTLGPTLTVAANLVGDGCDEGFPVGYASYNLISNFIYDATGRPGQGNAIGVRVNQNSSCGNLFTGILTYGLISTDYSARIAGCNNAVQISAQDSANYIATFDSGAVGNFVDVVHPGTRRSIVGAINDLSGSTGTDKNVVDCAFCGQWIGAAAGSFYWQLASAGAIYESADTFRFENNGTVRLVTAIPDGSGNNASWYVNTPVTRGLAWLRYVQGANHTLDYWSMETDSTSIWRTTLTAFRPETDNTFDLGASGLGWKNLYIDGVLSLNNSTGSINQIPVSNGSGAAAWGERTMPIGGCSNASIAAGSSLWYGLIGSQSGQNAYTKASAKYASGTISGFTAMVTSAPGGTETDTITIEQDGVDSASVATITGSATQATASTLTITAGQRLGLKVLYSASAATANVCWWGTINYH